MKLLDLMNSVYSYEYGAWNFKKTYLFHQEYMIMTSNFNHQLIRFWLFKYNRNTILEILLQNSYQNLCDVLYLYKWCKLFVPKNVSLHNFYTMTLVLSHLLFLERRYLLWKIYHIILSKLCRPRWNIRKECFEFKIHQHGPIFNQETFKYYSLPIYV